MRSYKVTAQSYTTSQRIVKTIKAYSEAEVIRHVTRDLDDAGFYVTDVRLASC